MPLKIALRPFEKLFIGGAVVQNGEHAAELAILNDVPLLREKEVITEAQSDTFCKRVQLCVQLMYMDPLHLSTYQQQYRDLHEQLVQAVPSTLPYLNDINLHLACGRYYQALKAARQLVDYEQELLAHARKSP